MIRKKKKKYIRKLQVFHSYPMDDTNAFSGRKTFQEVFRHTVVNRRECVNQPLLLTCQPVVCSASPRAVHSPLLVEEWGRMTRDIHTSIEM